MDRVTIPATDGLPIAATVFQSGGTAWASLASAVGVQQRYYRRFAEYLASRGINVVTFDYRGIGDSPETATGTGPATMRKWAERDLEAVLQWVRSQGPSRQFHIGHSGGGQFFGLCPSNRHVEAMVTVASQSGYWKHWPKHRLKMWMLWHFLLPVSTGLRGHFPAPWFGMGEPLPKGVALQWARWCRHPDFIVDDEGRPLRQHFLAYTGRARAIAITDDTRFAPRPAAEALMAFYEMAQAEVVDLAPADLRLEAIGHFGFFKPACKGGWDHMVDWLLDG